MIKRIGGKRVDVVTLRSPPPIRYRKIFESVSKIAHVNLVTGTIIPTIHLKMNIQTILAYAILLGKSLKKTCPTIMDVVASVAFPLRRKKDLVVDFRTPFPLELSWLGHRYLASLARAFEKNIKDVNLVFAANEKMALFCEELGANNVQVLPNYPPKSFKSTVELERWKMEHGLVQEDQVVLFTGGVRLKEIYGIDLLLDSWKLVENSDDSCFLIILGDDSIDYIRQRARILNIRHLLLPGRVRLADVANWINCADVCLVPRTPGFPTYFYNDKDSTKISEYAALGKPIVATGYSPSSQYLLVEQNPEAFAEGILKGLDGKITPPKPHYWEENEPVLLSALEDFWFEK